MGTRSLIGTTTDTGIRAAYVHLDGDSVGSTLDLHYNTADKAHELISHGYFSALGPTFDLSDGPPRPEETTEYPVRIETDIDDDDDASAFFRRAFDGREGYIEFAYFWNGTTWLARERNGTDYAPLHEQLEGYTQADADAARKRIERCREIAEDAKAHFSGSSTGDHQHAFWMREAEQAEADAKAIERRLAVEAA